MQNYLALRSDSLDQVPLVCAQSKERARAITTFLKYMAGCTVLPTKPLVGKAMSEGKPAAWLDIATADGAVRPGNWLILGAALIQRSCTRE